MREATKTFFQQHAFWLLAALIVCVLFAVMIVQYRSLRTLERTLPTYRRELMMEGLMAITSQVREIFSENAERALAVPAEAILTQAAGNGRNLAAQAQLRQTAERAARHFSQQQFKGAKRFFLALALGNGASARNEILFYQPERRVLEPAPDAPEWRAVQVACASYFIYIRERTELEPNPLGNDRDSDNPLILSPILNQERRILAVAGFVVDQDWFRRELLPSVIGAALPRVLPTEYQDAVVTLRLLGKDLTYAMRPRGSFQPEGEFKPNRAAQPEAAARFGPYLTRYALGLRMRTASIEQWARRSFILNLALSLAMALILLGGLLVTLRVAARAIKLAQMKTDFVANVSHEFRTPLASIRVLAEMMQQGRVRDFNKVREYGRYLDSESARLARLVENILDFARLEASPQQYQRTPTAVEVIVAQAVESCAVRLRERSGQMRIEWPDQPLPHVAADAAALTLAVANLLDNAIKYSDETAEILMRLEASADEVMLSVTDRGVGISREERARIFEKFYRVSTGMVHDVKGAGLGLAIVKQIVTAHGGRIGVESEIGRGSRFTIHLPVLEEAVAVPVASQRARAA